MSDVLQKILETKKIHVGTCRDATPLSSLEASLPGTSPRGFRDHLVNAKIDGRFPLIAEIKKASPSKGLIRADFDPATLAMAYHQGGAAALSVLTDQPYFQGNDRYLSEARDVVPLPALRKDFIIDPYQVTEGRVLGADCILLIMAALSDAQAAELDDAARALGMDVLIEVHDHDELERALLLKPDLLGINNRNLKTLEISLETFERLAPLAPPGCVLIAESGLYGHDDLLRMRDAGAGAYLVGESLMRQADVAAATRMLLGGDQ